MFSRLLSDSKCVNIRSHLDQTGLDTGKKDKQYKFLKELSVQNYLGMISNHAIFPFDTVYS